MGRVEPGEGKYKVNFVDPAKGERLLARGKGVRYGASLAVSKDDVLAYDGGEDTPVTTMLSTMMLMPNRTDLAGRRGLPYRIQAFAGETAPDEYPRLKQPRNGSSPQGRQQQGACRCFHTDIFA